MAIMLLASVYTGTYGGVGSDALLSQLTHATIVSRYNSTSSYLETWELAAYELNCTVCSVVNCCAKLFSIQRNPPQKLMIDHLFSTLGNSFGQPCGCCVLDWGSVQPIYRNKRDCAGRCNVGKRPRVKKRFTKKVRKCRADHNRVVTKTPGQSSQFRVCCVHKLVVAASGTKP